MKNSSELKVAYMIRTRTREKKNMFKKKRRRCAQLFILVFLLFFNLSVLSWFVDGIKRRDERRKSLGKKRERDSLTVGLVGGLGEWKRKRRRCSSSSSSSRFAADAAAVTERR